MKQIDQIQKKKIDTSGLVKKTNYDAKLTEIESKIPSISGLATTSTLTAVENKIRDVSNLIKKQIMTQRYQTLHLSILLQLIIISLLGKNLMQR